MTQSTQSHLQEPFSHPPLCPLCSLWLKKEVPPPSRALRRCVKPLRPNRPDSSRNAAKAQRWEPICSRRSTPHRLTPSPFIPPQRAQSPKSHPQERFPPLCVLCALCGQKRSPCSVACFAALRETSPPKPPRFLTQRRKGATLGRNPKSPHCGIKTRPEYEYDQNPPLFPPFPNPTSSIPVFPHN